MDAAVQHYGQVVAIVVAESYEQSQAAAMLVRPRYQNGQCVTRLDAVGRESIPDSVDHGQDADTGFAPPGHSFSEVLEHSAVVHSATYRTSAQSHAAMEPHNALAWWTADGRVLVRKWVV